MLRKVVILGPESTGKSTLAKDLAQYYGCPCVPEFAREYIEKLDRPYEYADLEKIGRGQIELEDQKAKDARGLLICDTDLQVIKVWSEHKYEKVSEWILEEIQKRRYDLYLLTDIDMPWEADRQREHPDPQMRKYFFDVYKNHIVQTGIPFKIISGNPTQRKTSSTAFIDTILR